MALIPDQRMELECQGEPSRGEYDRSKFRYREKADCYICPVGKKLKRVGTYSINGRPYHRYVNPGACRQCACKPACTTAPQRMEFPRFCGHPELHLRLGCGGGIQTPPAFRKRDHGPLHARLFPHSGLNRPSGRLPLLELLEFGRCEVAEVRVKPLAIVEDLHVFEYFFPGLLLASVDHAPN
jgi:hypothetical protein